uniref:Uncharacterized protein n=1 Tax=Eutreptiella gymnastica TaxID=73025 RepID=A0A7S1I2K4_9EUGL|mmetsp:Transcript_12420/g.22585  ORF Transcript_12420/g.22585 Transcript_12420/m.22585 type:complete len:310 (+) Transcript_12420:503-1432(+)
MGLDQEPPSEQTEATPRKNDLCEMDMEDMFWEIPKHEVVEALKWAIGSVKGRKKEQWFCLHRRGVRKLDRFGKGASSDYLSIRDEQVTRYVLFDIQEDTLFCFGRLILSQGKKGVPIGGFLSAHLAEIWCAWKEELRLFGDQKSEVEERVTSSLQNAFPGVGVKLSLLGHTDFTIAPHQGETMQCLGGMLRRPDIHNASKDAIDLGGFGGWWSPMDRLLGTLSTAMGPIHLVNTIPWDGSSGGRVDTIIHETEPKNKSRVRDFLRDVKPLYSIVGEVIHASKAHEGPLLTPLPCILLSRYRENAHIFVW